MIQKISSNFPLPMAKPEEVGISAERISQIGPKLQKYIDQKKVPNLTTIVARHGKLVYYDARGYMDVESKKPIAKDTLYRLYSNSKLIAGVVAMMLYEEGKLGLDDPISNYIPAFKNQMVLLTTVTRDRPMDNSMPLPLMPAVRGITIRDCLRNTTGLPTAMRMPLAYLALYRDVLIALGMYPGGGPSKATQLERLEAYAKLPLSFQPGTDFEYHVGYPILNVVFELAAGKPLDVFCQERIFEPLGMMDSSFYVPENKINRFPTCYRPQREGGEWKLIVTDTPENSIKVKGPKDLFDIGGSIGGVISTASDYTRFCQMLLNGGVLDDTRLLSRKSVEMMTANHIGNIYNYIRGSGFGFGLGVSQYLGGSIRPVQRSVGTFEWGGAAGTWSFMDPKEDLLGICFTQLLQYDVIPYQDDFERLVYQSLL